MINIISGISVAGVTVGTFALVVILSVFNGLDSSIKSLFSTFDPEIRISSTVKGKPFELSSLNIDAVRQIEGVKAVTPVIEEDAFLMYGKQQYFATIKGVPADYNEVSKFDTATITSGRFLLEADGAPFALVGQGVAYYLSVGLNFTEAIHVYALKKGASGRPTLENTLKHSTIYASGIFAWQQEIDSKYILVPIDFAKELFEMENRVSAVEITLANGASEDDVKKEILNQIGNQFSVKTQFEQHEMFYRVMQSEKWAIFFILAFILVIASFNILGSLSMLIIDKKDDIVILQSMGASQKLIRNIFLFEGWLISLAGAILGIVLGVLICWIQIRFGLLKIPNEGSFIFTAYPVEMRLTDIFVVFLLVTGIGFLAAWYPVRYTR